MYSPIIRKNGLSQIPQFFLNINTFESKLLPYGLANQKICNIYKMLQNLGERDKEGYRQWLVNTDTILQILLDLQNQHQQHQDQ